MDRKWWTLLAACTATFMLLLDITIVNVALPDIQKDLHSSFSDLQWVIDAYALMLASLLLTAGSLGDILGRRLVFAGGLVLFTASSLTCALATSPLFLNLARGAQGIGGAVMFATSLALIAQEFQGRERGTAFGIWGATIGFAVAVGPLVGGGLTEGLGWQWIFYINLPVGLVTCSWARSSRTNTTRSAADPAKSPTILRARPPLVVAADQREDEQEERAGPGDESGPRCSSCGCSGSRPSAAARWSRSRSRPACSRCSST